MTDAHEPDETSSRVTVVHDVDRDGLGAAAMVCAELGPDRVRIVPTKTKDVRPLLRQIDEPLEILVLDIPAPPSWDDMPVERDITWIDHHLAAWRSSPPANVRTILPADRRPTTTMSLLVKHRIVTVPNIIENYVGKLCGGDPDFEWGFVFDSMAQTYPDWPVTVAELPELLAGGPRGEPVPDALRPLVEQAASMRETVRSVLDDAQTRIHPRAVVVEIDDAHGIPLAQYSLAAQRHHEGKAAVVVHRGLTLYCGRASGRRGLDLVEHFRARGLDPKGHPYVVSVRVPRARMSAEVDAVVEALAEAP